LPHHRPKGRHESFGGPIGREVDVSHTGDARSLRDNDCAEDGHPAEAALEMRRILVVSGNAEEVPADVLDLAVSIAWLGKAMSRTRRMADLLVEGVDPNTWQVIGYAARSDEALAEFIEEARMERPAKGQAMSLADIRSSIAFRASCDAVSESIGKAGTDRARARLRTLRELLAIPTAGEVPARADVIDFAAAKGRLRG
jgi:hypothetical protein